jgi:hypothetical protein
MISSMNGRAAHAGLFENISKKLHAASTRNFAYALIGKWCTRPLSLRSLIMSVTFAIHVCKSPLRRVIRSS